jgi:hypothetical protein
VEVESAEAIGALLAKGGLRRQTRATQMNETSSRSHSIFTLEIERTRVVGAPPPAAARPSSVGNGAAENEEGSGGGGGDDEDAGLGSTTSKRTTKLNLVDLAGRSIQNPTQLRLSFHFQ